jgi:uncharacterized membrane-anchored protein YjiN (DUF445 family)
MSTHRARHLAAASLAIAGAGALVCLPFRAHPLGAAGFALFEAALVGGCADWFAVTALFRHPLGQRWVPHTAIIPKNRDRIIDNMVRMVEERLLSRDSLQRVLMEVPLLERLLDSLDRQALLDGLAKLLLDQARRRVHTLDPGALAEQLKPRLVRSLEQQDAPALWHRLRTSLLDDTRLEALVAEALGEAARVGQGKTVRQAIRGMLGDLVDRMVSGNPLFAVAKGFLNLDKMTELAAQGLAERLERAARQPQDELRLALRQALSASEPAPGVTRALDRLRQGVLDSGDQLAGGLARALHRGLEEWLAEPERHGELRALLATELTRFEQDPESRGRVEVWLRSRLLGLAEQHHHRIGELVRRNLEQLSPENLADELEERVGKDLQWIRVNGAVVGGLVGLALHGLLSIAGLSS